MVSNATGAIVSSIGVYSAAAPVWQGLEQVIQPGQLRGLEILVTPPLPAPFGSRKSSRRGRDVLDHNRDLEAASGKREEPLFLRVRWSIFRRPFAVALQKPRDPPEQKAYASQGENGEEGSLDYFPQLFISDSLQREYKRGNSRQAQEDAQGGEQDTPFSWAGPFAIHLEHDAPEQP